MGICERGKNQKNKTKKKQEKWTSRNQAMFSLFPIFFVSYGFLHFIYKYMYNCTFLPTPAFQKQSEEIFVYPCIYNLLKPLFNISYFKTVSGCPLPPKSLTAIDVRAQQKNLLSIRPSSSISLKISDHFLIDWTKSSETGLKSLTKSRSFVTVPPLFSTTTTFCKGKFSA